MQPNICSSSKKAQASPGQCGCVVRGSPLATKRRVFDSWSRASVRTLVPLHTGDQRAGTEGPLEDREGEDQKETGPREVCAPAHIRGRRTDALREAAGFSRSFQRIPSPANFSSLAAEVGAEMSRRVESQGAGNPGRLSLQPGTHRAAGCRQVGTQNLNGWRQRAGVPGPAPIGGCSAVLQHEGHPGARPESPTGSFPWGLQAAPHSRSART